MTLFDQPGLFKVKGQKVRRSKTAPSGRMKKVPPAWSRYEVKAPAQCDECVEIAYETIGQPMPLIRKAHFVRRHEGASRLLCYEHTTLQKERDTIAQ